MATQKQIAVVPRARTAGSALEEKRLERITLRISDTLKNRIQEDARAHGSRSISDYLVNLAYAAGIAQVKDGKTLSDSIDSLRRVLSFACGEESLSTYQLLLVLRMMTEVQMRLLSGGQKRRTA